ncbi:MAG: hypothetical protein WCK58_01055 [Chloroflexota bacterium]
MTESRHPTPARPADYKGEPLDAERGPGLGCFWSQLITLIVLLVLTPLTVVWAWASWISIVLLFATLIILLFAGQTVIFLLRLVAADRRDGRRVPLAAASQTVGEIEDTLPVEGGAAAAPTPPHVPARDAEPHGYNPFPPKSADQPPAGPGVRE